MRNRAVFFFSACILTLFPVAAQSQLADQPIENNLTYAVAWKQTAAEYHALYHQGFNIARMHVARTLAGRKDSDRPLAVITDVDDTVLLSPAYWGYLVAQDLDFFDDPSWDNWICDNRLQSSPGASMLQMWSRGST